MHGSLADSDLLLMDFFPFSFPKLVVKPRLHATVKKKKSNLDQNVTSSSFYPCSASPSLFNFGMVGLV